MARKKKRVRKRYTDEQRSQIMAAASKEGLTASVVQKRFGVKPITYYSWRKKAGTPKTRGGKKVRAGKRATPKGGLQAAVQARVRALLPQIVNAEVDRYLDEAFGVRRGQSRRG